MAYHLISVPAIAQTVKTPTVQNHVIEETPKKTPERELCASILSGAIYDLYSKNSRDKWEAEQFFETTGSGVKYNAFSFEDCCDALEIDAARTLKAIKDPKIIEILRSHRC